MRFRMLLYAIIIYAGIYRPVYTKDTKTLIVAGDHRKPNWIKKIRTHTKNSALCEGFVVVKLLRKLRWRLVIVIYDNSNEDLLRSITKQMTDSYYGMVLEFHNIEHQNTASVSSLLADVHQRLFPRLDFLLMTKEIRAWEILDFVNMADSLSSRTSDFNYHSKWLVLLPSGQFNYSLNRLNNLQNVAFIKTSCSVKGTDTTVKTLVHDGQSVTLQNILNINHLNNTILFPSLKYGYSGRKLTVATLSVSTFIQTKIVNNVTKYSGFCVYMLDALAHFLNFTYEFVEPAFGTWGVLVNGSWNGLVGVMERREADLALADITININRSKVMDFLLPPFYFDYIDIIYKEEIYESATWFTLLRPFSSVVFAWIVSFTCGFVVVYSATIVLIRKRCSLNTEPRSLSDVFWFTISSLFKQGSTIHPSTHGIRVLVSAWLLFVLIVVAEYTANLTAAFTVRPGIKPFESLRQLLDNPNYKLGTFPGGITTMIMKNSENQLYRDAWSKIVSDYSKDADVLSESESKQLEKVKGGNYAFIRNDAALRAYMTENCGLQRLGISLDWQPVSIGVPKNSTLKAELGQVLRRLETSGIYDYWWQLHESHLKRPVCPSRQRSVSSSITLDDIKSGFVLLGAGIFMALVSLIFEILRDRYKMYMI